MDDDYLKGKLNGLFWSIAIFFIATIFNLFIQTGFIRSDLREIKTKLEKIEGASK